MVPPVSHPSDPACRLITAGIISPDACVLEACVLDACVLTRSRWAFRPAQIVTLRPGPCGRVAARRGCRACQSGDPVVTYRSRRSRVFSMLGMCLRSMPITWMSNGIRDVDQSKVSVTVQALSPSGSTT